MQLVVKREIQIVWESGCSFNRAGSEMVADLLMALSR